MKIENVSKEEKDLERRMNFIGHLLRHSEFGTNVIETKVLGKRG